MSCLGVIVVAGIFWDAKIFLPVILKVINIRLMSLFQDDIDTCCLYVSFRIESC